MTKQHLRGKSENGGVSIFVVIFTALLVTVVTTSFVQIMMRSQQQATNNDLSQSAYDAALAGVEDAKRALIKLKNCEGDTTPTCAAIRAAFRDNADECSFLGSAIGADFGGSGEVQVGDEELNQAYTCVKVITDTPSVKDTLEPNVGSKTVRLKGTDSFNNIRISWYTDKDIIKTNLPPYPVATAPATIFPDLPASTAWESADPGKSTPPLLRAQLIQFNGDENIDLGTFSTEGTKNARTAFLYPFSAITPTGARPYFNSDSRLSGSGNSPREVHCNIVSEYKCSVVLEVPTPEGAGASANNREAYLQLAALYNGTSFQIELLNGNDIVNFDGVQPIVDSTGRASDLFRRVKANISIEDGSDLPVPDAALSVNSDLCKNFIVTNRVGDYATRCTTP